tara:strand:+ start:6597 stop:6884 length:288 start_codon:yes stop_codon:yes gene_type:complete
LEGAAKNFSEGVPERYFKLRVLCQQCQKLLFIKYFSVFKDPPVNVEGSNPFARSISSIKDLQKITGSKKIKNESVKALTFIRKSTILLSPFDQVS